MIIATKGSKLDNMDAFEASTCLMLLFQIKFAAPCTTTAVMNNKVQSENSELIRKGLLIKGRRDRHKKAYYIRI